MRTALVRRTVLTASAASLALLATACGSSGTDKADAKPSVSASAPAPSPTPEVKALGAAELEKLTLVQGDVAKALIDKAGADDVAKATEVSTDKPECQPLGLAGSLAPVGKAVTTTERVVATEPTDPGNPLSVTATDVQLASYDGKGAEEALASLKAAGQACAGGFTVTAKADKTVVKKVVSAPVSVGDDSVAWSLTATDDGETLKSSLVVFRKGNNLAVLHSIDLSGKATAQPKAVIDAQLKKLG